MSKNKHNHFLLYSNCIPVMGAKRSIICDLQMGRYKFIPNILFEILTKYRNVSIEKIEKLYNHSYDGGIAAYFKLLSDDEWGFYTDEPDVFPQLDLKWDFPGLISNAIIDIDQHSQHDYNAIFAQLDSLGCASLQIRIFYNIDLNFFQEMLSKTNNSNLSYIEVYFPNKANLEIYDIKEVLIKNLRIRLMYSYGADENKLVESEYGIGKLFFIKESISFSSHCGYVNDEYFQSNISLFTESQKFNSCLNRKVAIDRNGQIKNCPYTKEIYGHIKENKISEIVISGEFKKYWEINKNQIETCKDCEFRYICTDCRAFLKDTNNLFSKPFYCSYNPYKAKWEESI